jgi:predicted nicotinamide N-methyase
MDLIEKYGLERKRINIGNISMNLFHTDNIDGFFDKLDPVLFEKDERFPYFVNIWQSGMYLSRYLVEEFNVKNIKGKSFLELGSGTGVTGLALSILGGQVTFSDYEEDSLSLCKLNSLINGFSNVNTILADWRNFPETGKSFDYVIGSDLLYEKRFLMPLVKTTKHFIENGSTFLYSDPGRNYYIDYLDIMMKEGFETALLKEYKPAKNQEIKIFMVKKRR